MVKTRADKVRRVDGVRSKWRQIFATHVRKAKRYNALLDPTRISNKRMRNVNKRVCGRSNKQGSSCPRAKSASDGGKKRLWVVREARIHRESVDNWQLLHVLISSNGYTRTALTYMVVGVTIFTVLFGVRGIFLRGRIVIVLENRTGEEIVAWLFADLANDVRCLTFWRSCSCYWGWRGLLFLFLFLFLLGFNFRSKYFY